MKVLISFVLSLIIAVEAFSYPLDGDTTTGITRLEGYRLAKGGVVQGRKIPEGAKLMVQDVDLRLQEYAQMELPEPDPQFSKEVKRLLGKESDRYGFAVLDLTDPEHPRYAEHRGEINQNPGSVGKILVALGIFQALADISPDDIDARLRLLRTSMITADSFIIKDSHDVPFWNRETGKLEHRPIQTGDRANLYTYLDWMLSASSNAAASMVMKHLMLMVHFGKDYPVSNEEGDRFFKKSPKKKLRSLLKKALQDPVTRNGLKINHLRQGKFFTWGGKQKVPGGPSSVSSPRELVRLLLRMEQGRLVDTFSSREIKRLLYITQKRIRYASSPALSDGAVYFKSGSLYSCAEEADFVCEKYKGNRLNMMNSVAIIESPAKERNVFYLSALLSNILGENSAVRHQTFATWLHRLIESEYKTRSDESVKKENIEK